MPPAEPAQRLDGPYFRVADERFVVRGVTYGTFGGEHPDLLPAGGQVDRDFAAIVRAGFNTVRTYTEPRPEVLDLAAEHGLHLLVGLWWQDDLHHSAPDQAGLDRLARRGAAAVRGAARRCGTHPAVLGLLVGNEFPAGAVRYHGPRAIERLLARLREAGREGDPTCPLGYANYPTTGYLDTSCLDFDCVNVFLEDDDAFRSYLAELRLRSGQRPLILGELGLDSRSHGERRQADVLDRQLRAAYAAGLGGTCVFSWTDDWWVAGRRVPEWAFGLTRADRTPKPALDAVARRHATGLPGVRESWPLVSVVVCAHQAQATLDECLAGLHRTRYPDYEVIVVDDGSTDATAAIADRYPVRLLSDGHRGLSGARNLGAAHATGEIVAYLDADAYPDPDWPYYLVLGLDRPGAVAVGGPNVVPPRDPPLARAIFEAPGGPVPVLLDDEYAEHVPGCNMAYRREVLAEAGGFDPVYTSAGDDADVCWKLLDGGHRIAYHPAALVWHHPRGSVRGFWRQQVGYGRAEAMLAVRHPRQFTTGGHARWSGAVYPAPSPLRLAGRLYTGLFGRAPYQRLYGGSAVPMRHALGAVLALAALGLVVPSTAVLAIVAVVALLAAVLLDGRAAAHRAGLAPRWAALIGLLHLLQPVAREVGRFRRSRTERAAARPGASPAARRLTRDTYTVDGVDEDGRPALLVALRDRMSTTGLGAELGDEWGRTDLSWRAGPFWRARATSCATTGGVHLRLVRRLRPGAALLVSLLVAGCWLTWGTTTAAVLAAVVVVAAAVESLVLARRTRSALAGAEVAAR